MAIRIRAKKEIRVKKVMSLRCDRSVDRTQTDKLFVMIEALDAHSEEQLYFLGADEPDERCFERNVHCSATGV